MQGRDFLEVARELVGGATEAHWRATVIHAYYALFLECRETLVRWGITFLQQPNVHSAVRLRFLYAADPDLKRLGRDLDRWCGRRNHANYNLGVLRQFASNRLAQDAIQEAIAALALLDAIETAPARRAAAIAAFPP